MVSEFTQDVDPKQDSDSWPGIALLLQNVLILMSSLLYKFGRTDEATFGGF